MKIEVFYSMRCGKCRIMETAVHAALEELDLDVDVEKVLNPQEAVARGVRSQPALWINGRLKAAGSVPLVSDIKRMVLEEMEGTRAE